MNLIPIDTGGTPTELVGGDASPGGDFAALMNGLMTGDTQIVPLIDIPASEQLSEHADTAVQDETGDVAASILEFIGTPPAGLTMSPLRQSTASHEAHESIDGTAVPAAPVPDSLETDATIDPADAQALATVHPIRAADTTSTSSETDTVSDTLVTGLARVEPSGHPGAVSPVTGPETGATPSAQTATRAGAEALETTPLPTAETPMTASATRHGATDRGLDTSTVDQPGGDAHITEPDVDIDTGTAVRQFDTARPGSAITQPAMVGIARRVEEAIAALATKPDPKIVTLQLDELDGLRLTVALRPDGIHLSSSGDATLRTEIERALASRGFDMASGSDRGRQGSQESTDDRWRPQPATPGRQPRTNPSGIRL